jgi:hypothetical protein
MSRSRRDSLFEPWLLKRDRAGEEAAVEAIAEAVEPVDLEYSGPVPEPEDDAIAVGGEPEWTWAEWLWFGEVAA